MWLALDRAWPDMASVLVQQEFLSFRNLSWMRFVLVGLDKIKGLTIMDMEGGVGENMMVKTVG